MTRWTTVAAVLVALSCGWSEPREGADWERMLEQERYDAYEHSEFFADERVLQHPPPGTVPRSRIIGEPALTEGLVDGTPVTSIPIPVTEELLALGRTRYGIFCAACHGAGGYGGSIVALNMWPMPPPSLRADSIVAHAPGHVYRIITNGSGRMPSYASELPVLDRWAVVAYLRALQQRGAVLPEERVDSVRAAMLLRRVARPAPIGAPGDPASSVRRAATPVLVPEGQP